MDECARCGGSPAPYVRSDWHGVGGYELCRSCDREVRYWSGDMQHRRRQADQLAAAQREPVPLAVRARLTP